MSAQLNSIDYEEDTVPPDIAQRITCAFNISFTSQQAFDEIPVGVPAQNITLTLRHCGNSEIATMLLSGSSNPKCQQLHLSLRVRPGSLHA
jgi:azurin